MTATSFDLRAQRRSHGLDALRDEVRQFIAEEISQGLWRPAVDTWLGGFDREFSRRLGARGWIGMTWPMEYGGHERTSFERYVVIEELLAAGAPVAAHWVADRQIGPLLLRFGTEEQRQKYLPGIAAGELTFAIGMSEPDSGSDLASIKTRAVRDGDGWRITGTKIWTTSAHAAQFMNVLVRTDSDGESRHEGMSQFVLPMDTPGITVRPIPLLNGEHDFNEVVFDGAYVHESGLLGELGAGWYQVNTELAYERSGPERFLSAAPVLRSFVDAHQGTLAADQHIALGYLGAKLWALRQMSLAVAATLEEGGNAEVPAALVKDIGTSFEQEMVERLREASSVSEWESETAHEFHALLDLAIEHSPGFTLRGGTSEILRTIIGRGLGL